MKSSSDLQKKRKKPEQTEEHEKKHRTSESRN